MPSEDGGWDQWRDLPSAGAFGPEHAGESGIDCPVCSRDTGHSWRCAHCGKPDPGASDVVEASGTSTGPERWLDVPRDPPPSGWRTDLAMHIRGLRTPAQVDAWIDTERDLMAEPSGTLLELLVAQLAQRLVDEDLGVDLLADPPLDEPEPIQAVLDREIGREEPRGCVVGACNRLLDDLEDDADEQPTADTTAAVATDGGTDTEGSS